MTDPDPPYGGEPQASIADLRASLAFLTRLPPSWLGGQTTARPDFARASRMFPLTGAVVGLIGGAVLVFLSLVGLPPLPAVALAILATILVTGGLHEDGLADTADGFGGGATVERKLEIMRDSRVGTYGVIAIAFSILLRVGALWGLAAASPGRAALVLVASETISRAALMRVWHDLPPARTDGLAHDTGPPGAQAMMTAQVLAAIIAIATASIGAGPVAAIVGVLLCIGATYMVEWMSRRQIGGRTGDTLGAVQQIAAIAFLVGVTIGV